MSKVTFRGDLKGLLEVRGVTQTEFAFSAGLSLASVNRAVRGEEISHLTFGKIVRALGAVPPLGRNGRASGTSLGVKHSAVAGPRRPAAAKP